VQINYNAAYFSSEILQLNDNGVIFNHFKGIRPARFNKGQKRYQLIGLHLMLTAGILFPI
jgi:hypothetical protein